MEGENYETRVVAIEGGDQVGKGDAILNLAKALVEEGESITMLALPFYALPIGMGVRKMLCSSQDELKGIEGMEYVIGTSRQTEIAMAMFALNRLEVLRTLKEAEGLVMLDRSAFSHALTISYNIFLGNIQREKMEEFAYKGIEMDQLFINELNLSNCVLNLRTERSKWNATRGKGEDMYEREEVQDICDSVYDVFKKYSKEGWKKIITRKDDSWRNREDILQENLEFVHNRISPKRESKGSLKILSAKDISNDVYPDVEISPEEEKLWMEAVIANDKQRMYQASVNIAQEIANKIKEVTMSSEIKEAFKKILDKYPEVYSLLEAFAGSHYVLVLREAVNGQENISKTTTS